MFDVIDLVALTVDTHTHSSTLLIQWSEKGTDSVSDYVRSDTHTHAEKYQFIHETRVLNLESDS